MAKKLRKTTTELEGYVIRDGVLRWLCEETEDDSYCATLDADNDDSTFADALDVKDCTVIRVQSLAHNWIERVWLLGADKPVEFTVNLEMTIRREVRSGKNYWYAYRRRGGKLYKRYVGTSDSVTTKRLVEVAKSMP